LLRFQDPANYDIINKLEGIENLMNEQISVENATETVAKSLQESNNKMVQDLSQIKTSINRELVASNNLTSIQTSKNEITQDLSQLKSSINTPSSWSSYLSRAVISSIVAAMVSAVVILLLLRIYKTRIGVRFNELKFKRKYR
jgi:phenylalanyl-tRNA synthetase alpha subunit